MSKVESIPLKEIFLDEKFNCRGKILPLEVMELAQNIREQGLIQPIIVQPYDKGPPGTKYRVVAGYRRAYAHLVNKETHIDSIIKEGLSNRDAKFLNLSENLNRQDLNIMQEARVLQQFFDEGMTQQEIADKVNKSRSWVTMRLYALKLPEPIQQEIEVGLINQTHIRALQDLPEDQQMSLVKDIKEKREKGEKTPLTKAMVKKDPKAKTVRVKAQMDRMRDHILETIGANIGSRALAWAVGNISSEDLFNDIAEMAEEMGIPYIAPQEDF